jgi:hypothetical protein
LFLDLYPTQLMPPLSGSESCTCGFSLSSPSLEALSFGVWDNNMSSVSMGPEPMPYSEERNLPRDPSMMDFARTVCRRCFLRSMILGNLLYITHPARQDGDPYFTGRATDISKFVPAC